MNIQEIDPSGLAYDITIGYGKDDEKNTIHTIDHVVRIEGYGNDVRLTGDTIANHRCLSNYEMNVNFFRADGVLVGSFPRGSIRAIELSVEEEI